MVDWKSTVGMDLDLLYEGDIYSVKITKNEGEKIYVNYNGYIYENGSTKSNFYKGHFGRILGLINNRFKFFIAEHIKDNKRDLIITGKEYRDKKRKGRSVEKEKWYKYTCNKCGWTEGWMVEGDLKRGNGCSCCAGRTTVLGINTIWDTDRWMVDLGVSEEDAKKYTPSSCQKIEVACPDCGNKKRINISKIYTRKSISCACGDRSSYPEKFTTNLLTQLNIKFQTQLSSSTFEWCEKYRYDFYLPDYNCIIETHGRQHYERAKGFYKPLEEEQENDRCKERLAKENGIGNYIVIDCRHSDLEWIKNNVLNSKLNELFDLSKVDWTVCEEFALKNNKIKEVCEYWNNKEEWETTYTISESNEWGINSSSTICNYLKKGTKLGWCNYDPKEENEKTIAKKSKEKWKAVKGFKR